MEFPEHGLDAFARNGNMEQIQFVCYDDLGTEI